MKSIGFDIHLPYIPFIEWKSWYGVSASDQVCKMVRRWIGRKDPVVVSCFLTMCKRAACRCHSLCGGLLVFSWMVINMLRIVGNDSINIQREQFVSLLLRSGSVWIYFHSDGMNAVYKLRCHNTDRRVKIIGICRKVRKLFICNACPSAA